MGLENLLKNVKYLAQVGAGLFIVVLILVWQKMVWVPLGLLITIGLIDLLLVFVGENTISQWIHSLFPKWLDTVIMIGLLIYTWAVWGGPEIFVPAMTWLVIGHLLWQRKED